MKQLSELDRKMNGTESFSMQEYHLVPFLLSFFSLLLFFLFFSFSSDIILLVRYYVDTFQQYGFTKEAAERALKKTDDNFDLALDLLLNSLEN